MRKNHQIRLRREGHFQGLRKGKQNIKEWSLGKMVKGIISIPHIKNLRIEGGSTYSYWFKVHFMSYKTAASTPKMFSHQ